jgi:hypothetical protein
VSNLHLTVEVTPGADCREAIHEMARLSTHLRVPVEAKMNGVTVRAIPYCDSRALGDAWDAEMVKPERPFKFVCGRPFTLGTIAKDEAAP